MVLGSGQPRISLKSPADISASDGPRDPHSLAHGLLPPSGLSHQPLPQGAARNGVPWTPGLKPARQDFHQLLLALTLAWNSILSWREGWGRLLCGDDLE